MGPDLSIFGFGGRLGPDDGVVLENFVNGQLISGLGAAFLLRVDPGVVRSLLSVTLRITILRVKHYLK
jgi:hypothetical protein